MTSPVPTRFSGEELALIDRLVEEGVGESRSAVIRLGLHRLAESVDRARVGASIAQSYRERPQTGLDHELAIASAIAMTEAEPRHLGAVSSYCQIGRPGTGHRAPATGHQPPVSGAVRR